MEVRGTVLVVDDDRDIRDTMRLALEDEGYTVREASNGAQALALLRHTRERLVVLLDVSMPVLDGLGVLEAVTHDENLRVRHAYVLCSASTRTHLEEARERFASLPLDLLAKPFDLERLLALVEREAQRLASPPLFADEYFAQPAASA